MTSLEATERFIKTIADVAIQNEQYFAELDGVCGDGDFGISLAAGFNKVMEQWDALDRTSPGTLLKGVASTIASRVGGVSGAIWGTAFLRAGVAAGDKPTLTVDDIATMLEGAIAGMKKRGQSDLGDKTLLDAFVPAGEEFVRVARAGSSTAEALKAASVVARAKTEEIKPWVAKRGRASYTGERSCNTYDAGSVAIAMMAEKLAETWAHTAVTADEKGVR